MKSGWCNKEIMRFWCFLYERFVTLENERWERQNRDTVILTLGLNNRYEYARRIEDVEMENEHEDEMRKKKKREGGEREDRFRELCVDTYNTTFEVMFQLFQYSLLRSKNQNLNFLRCS